MTHGRFWPALLCIGLAACGPGGFSTSDETVFAPSVDPRGDAVDQVLVGHRLMAAGEYEQALQLTAATDVEQRIAEIFEGIPELKRREPRKEPVHPRWRFG